MRHALALLGTGLAVTACQTQPEPKMQPDVGEGYTVTITGAAIGPDNPWVSDDRPRMMDDVARRLAAEMCDREAHCHAVTRTAEECWNANLGRVRNEISSWRCSPAAMRARTKDCLAAVRNESCEYAMRTGVESRRPGGGLCVPNAACDPDER